MNYILVDAGGGAFDRGQYFPEKCFILAYAPNERAGDVDVSFYVAIYPGG